MKTSRMLALVALTALQLMGCGASRTSGLCEKLDVGAAKPGDFRAVAEAGDAEWAKRESIHSLKKAIASWREAVAINPMDSDTYLKLARALYMLGDGYLRLDDDEEGMTKALEEATFFAERSLQVRNDAFRRSVCSRQPFAESVKKLRKSDVPAAYWYATALGKYGLATNIVTVLDNKDRIYAIMKRIQRIHPDYYYGAAERYLGAYFTKIPFPQGDWRKSRTYFEKSLKRAPNYLATHVLMAEMLAPKYPEKADARRLAKKHLDFVLKAPIDIIKGLEAEHRLEKRKAELMMEDFDTLFPAD